jgi:hypothetical protein
MRPIDLLFARVYVAGTNPGALGRDDTEQQRIQRIGAESAATQVTYRLECTDQTIDWWTFVSYTEFSATGLFALHPSHP